MSDKPLKLGQMLNGKPQTKKDRELQLKTFEALVRYGHSDDIHDDLLRYVAEGVRQFLEGEKPWKLTQGKSPKGDPRQHAKVAFDAHILPLWRTVMEDAKPLPVPRFAGYSDDHQRSVRRMLERAVKSDEHLNALQPFIAALAEANGLPPGRAYSVDGLIRWMSIEQWRFYREELQRMRAWIAQRFQEANRLHAEGHVDNASNLLNKELTNLDWLMASTSRRSSMFADDAYREDFEATIGAHVNVLNSNPLAPPPKNVRSEQQRWFELMFYTPIPLPWPEVRTGKVIF